MASGDFWVTVMDRYGVETQPKRIGAIRAALLFGTAAIAMAVILTPIVAERTTSRVAWSPDQFDNITTGSISARGNTRTYTVRKSILQDMPGSLCIIGSDGRTSGDC